MRKIISGMHVSLDGSFQGPEGEQDWVDAWDDPYRMSDECDACLLGGGMYPGYENYWTAVSERPNEVLPFSGKLPTAEEVAYGKFARSAPHIVLSNTLNSAAWANTRFIRDMEAVRALKAAPGKSIYAIGGAGLVSSLVNAGLLNELRLVVHPLLLGGGKPLFKGIRDRHKLKLLEAKSLQNGELSLRYALAA